MGLVAEEEGGVLGSEEVIVSDTGSTKEGVEDTVSLTITSPQRDASGKFVKGNKIRPRNPGGGRPRKLDSAPVLEAISTEFTVEEIRGMLRKALTIAVDNDEWKGVLEVVRFVASYAIGKPVQRSIKAEIDVEQFIELFSPRGDDDGETIQLD